MSAKGKAQTASIAITEKRKYLQIFFIRLSVSLLQFAFLV